MLLKENWSMSRKYPNESGRNEGYDKQKWAENHLTLEKPAALIINPAAVQGDARGGIPGPVSQPEGREDGRQGEGWTNCRQPPGWPYTAGWPQLKADLVHLGGLSKGEGLAAQPAKDQCSQSLRGNTGSRRAGQGRRKFGKVKSQTW